VNGKSSGIHSMEKNKKQRHRFKKGYTPWNKGLTKDADKRLIKTEEYKKSVCGKGNPFYRKKHTVESKKKMLENRKYIVGKDNPSFGKHIWADREHPKGMLGKKGYWLGKHRSEATKMKLRIANLGKKHSIDSKKKMSQTHNANWKKPEFVEKWKKGMQKAIIIPTKPEIFLNQIIKKNKLLFDYTGDGKIRIDRFNPDFLNIDKKLIIEVFGDYWHNLKDVKLRDERKLKAYLKNGYKVLIIWEHELTGKNVSDRLSEGMIVDKINNIENYI